jgi:hypothetical protein
LVAVVYIYIYIYIYIYHPAWDTWRKDKRA